VKRPAYRPFSCLSLSLILLLCVSGCEGDDSPQAFTSRFDVFVEKTRLMYKVPGAAVGIVDNDKVVFLEGFGIRGINDFEPVNKDTRFQIASNTKFMTAAAIGLLVDRGRVSWDTPLINYYPHFRLKEDQATNNATFRDMLAHRSGLRAYDGGLLGRLGYDYRERLRRARYMELEPFRANALYSNMGYFIAGEIAAMVCGLSVPNWEQFMKTDFLEPLGLTRSSPYHQDLYLDENHVAGHVLENGRVRLMDLEVDSLPPAGQMISTAADMCRWMRMLLSGGRSDGVDFLRESTVRELFKPVIANGDNGPLNEPGGANALGCNTFTFLGHTVVEKNGALDGVRSIVTLVPELKIGIVVLANLNLTVFPEAVRAEFLEEYLGPSGKDLQPFHLERLQPAWDSLTVKPSPPATPTPLPVSLNDLAGTYTSELYGMFSVSVDGTQLQIASQTPLTYTGTMTHHTNLTFLLVWPDPDDPYGMVTFTRDTGRVTGFTGATPMLDYGRFTKQ